MQRFLLKILLLASMALAISAILATTAYRGLPKKKKYGAEVFRAIKVCSASNPQSHTLVLGDSVAYQIFGVRIDPETDDANLAGVAVAACNQAVTPLGNRILLDHWLERNPQATRVVYVLMPMSLRNDGSRKFTFHYFIYPFATTGLLDGGYGEIIAHLCSKFGSLPVKNKSFRNLLYRNERLYELYERHFAGDRTRDPEGGLPPMVLKQLMAMQEACVARGVEMRIAFSPLSHPVSEEYKSRLVAQLGQTFPDIGESLANIRMEPSANFKDGIHFTRDHLLEERVRLRAELLGLK